jgi:hypothetical protein
LLGVTVTTTITWLGVDDGLLGSAQRRRRLLGVTATTTITWLGVDDGLLGSALARGWCWRSISATTMMTRARPTSLMRFPLGLHITIPSLVLRHDA